MQLALAADHAGLDLKEELAVFLAAFGPHCREPGHAFEGPRGLPRLGARRGRGADAGAGRARHRGVRQRRRRVDRGQQDSGDPGRRLPRHLHGAPGGRARRHERAVPRRARRGRRAGQGDSVGLLAARFSGEARHQRRLDKLLAIEREFTRANLGRRRLRPVGRRLGRLVAAAPPPCQHARQPLQGLRGRGEVVRRGPPSPHAAGFSRSASVRSAWRRTSSVVRRSTRSRTSGYHSVRNAMRSSSVPGGN